MPKLDDNPIPTFGGSSNGREPSIPRVTPRAAARDSRVANRQPRARKRVLEILPPPLRPGPASTRCHGAVAAEMDGAGCRAGRGGCGFSGRGWRRGRGAGGGGETLAVVCVLIGAAGPCDAGCAACPA